MRPLPMLRNAWPAVAAIVIAGTAIGCSGDANDENDASTATPTVIDSGDSEDSEDAGDSEDSDDAGDSGDSRDSDDAGDSGDSGDAGDSGEAVVRLPVNPGDNEPSNWVARTYMDDARVEVVWSPVDGAERYQLYRLPRDDADYDAIAEGVFTNAQLVYEGSDYGFIDDQSVPSGVFLTYVLVAEIDGAITQPRWTEALTIADTDAPTPVENLRAEVTVDGVLLSWDPSTDNVEFAAYNVVYLAEDGSWQYIGGGADEGQTSFLDTEPRTGANTYQVRAFDFHDNGTEPAEITVDLASG